MAKSNTVSAARLAAFDVLKEVEAGVFSSVLLAAAEPKLEPLDRALCHELVLGVLRWQLQLDAAIEHYSKRNIATLDLPVLLALRLGLYQLRFLSRIPASAAVNESVNLVARARLSSARPFVNAVLRRAVREPEYSPSSDVSDPLQRVALETSHPRWLIERWAEVFGLEWTESFARANNQSPPTSIRVVRNVASEEDVLENLRAAGASLIPSVVAKHAWRVSGAVPKVRQLVEQGKIYIQDEASQLVAEVVDARAEDHILDLCAAPGGKTSLFADRSNDTARVVGSDFSFRRLETLARTVELQRLKNVRLLVLDARRQLPFTNKTFDKVLVDAPCSGTGTLRHNPEIRWRLTPPDIDDLSRQQLELLMNASAVVKTGGTLVYSTCSVEPEENEQVVDEFLRLQGGYQQVPVKTAPELLTNTGAVRTWPHRHGTDGFFVAALQRINLQE